jgi:hypothetical protein
MRRRIILTLFLAASHLLFFIGGAALGRHTALSDFVSQTEHADARVTLGHYTIYRDIAVAINGTRYDRAKCSARLAASSMFDDVKSCVGNSACRRAVEKEAHKMAPEVLGEEPVGFGYIASKGGGRSCE